MRVVAYAPTTALAAAPTATAAMNNKTLRIRGALGVGMSREATNAPTMPSTELAIANGR